MKENKEGSSLNENNIINKRTTNKAIIASLIIWALTFWNSWCNKKSENKLFHQENKGCITEQKSNYIQVKNVIREEKNKINKNNIIDKKLEDKILETEDEIMETEDEEINDNEFFDIESNSDTIIERNNKEDLELTWNYKITEQNIFDNFQEYIDFNNETNLDYEELIQNQTSPIMYWDRTKPGISITFDDWYWKENISTILEILEWSDIKTTFFILWECINLNPDLRRLAAEQWHQICCHTYSHIYLSDKSEYTSLTTWLNSSANKWWKREKNVKNILWEEYYKKIKTESWEWFPLKIKSTVLLRTEILMREETIKNTLWADYLVFIKQNHPFFRFPWWCWAHRKENINVLKELWYLSIWRSEDFARNNSKWKWRRHLTQNEMENINIPNWSIALFHFKKDDFEYVKWYIKNNNKRELWLKSVWEILPKGKDSQEKK